MADIVIVSAIAAAAFTPWVPAMWSQTRAVRAHYWTSPPDGDAVARAVSGLAGVNEQGVTPWDVRGDWGVVVALILFAGIGMAVPRTRRAAAATAAYAGLPVVGLLVYSRVGQSIFIERAFLVSGVGFAVLAMVPVELAPAGTRRRVAAGAWAACLGLAVGLSLPGRYQGEHPEPWREASAFAASSPATRRAVVCVANEGELLWDYYGRGGTFGPAADVAGAPASFFAADPPRTMRQVATGDDLAGVRRLLDRGGFDELDLLASHTPWADADGRTLAMVAGRLPLVEERAFAVRPGGTPVTVYRFGPAGGQEFLPSRSVPVRR